MRIMVPVDGTPECEEAVPVAARLAKSLGAEVHLVRIVEVIDAFSPLRHEPELATMVKETTAYLHDVAHRWELPPEQTKCLVNYGDKVANEITELVRSNDIDVIVMTTHGRKGLQRWAQGSVRDEVVRARACAVMVVPDPCAQEAHGRHAGWYKPLSIPGGGRTAPGKQTSQPAMP
ncbi:MAG: hypothetical protein A2Y61_06595 [Chloroflexi bacterium RBG_13_60_13]|nr:MAG: hypothetical protein A2Y61_06595 [Chloroflexi bacterium RBG_13_60_13]